jgi:hypothetical protein
VIANCGRPGGLRRVSRGGQNGFVSWGLLYSNATHSVKRKNGAGAQGCSIAGPRGGRQRAALESEVRNPRPEGNPTHCDGATRCGGAAARRAARRESEMRRHLCSSLAPCGVCASGRWARGGRGGSWRDRRRPDTVCLNQKLVEWDGGATGLDRRLPCFCPFEHRGKQPPGHTDVSPAPSCHPVRRVFASTVGGQPCRPAPFRRRPRLRLTRSLRSFPCLVQSPEVSVRGCAHRPLAQHGLSCPRLQSLLRPDAPV